MKRAFFLMLLVHFSIFIIAQVPQGFNYQAIARDASGNPLANKPLQVKLMIRPDSSGTGIIWGETHNSVTTNSMGMFTVILGKGARQQESTVAKFTDIDWSVTPKFLQTDILYNSLWIFMGVTRLYSVPYAMVANDLGGTLSNLKVRDDGNNPIDSALFEVKNKNGQTVFAVYNEGVRVYVDDGIAKGATKGGFAIGGFGTVKSPSQEFFRVSRDSTRIYLNDTGVKNIKGGFAIGGFGTVKSPGQEFFRVTRDSTRIYLNDTGVKNIKGGFAIGGFDNTKGVNQDYMNISKDSIRIYIDDKLTKGNKGGFAIGSFDRTKGGNNASFFNIYPDSTGKISPSQNKILWYPLKNAFITGKVLVEHKDSVGENSFASGFESKAKGKYSQALGYQAVARGVYSTAIGRSAIANNSSSFAFGNSAQALNESSFAFGTGAKAMGINSYALGSIGIDSVGNPTGQNTISSGNNSVAIGMGSQSTNLGAFSFGIGNIASGEFSLAMGFESMSPADYGIAIGRRSTAMEAFSIAIGDSALVTNNTSIAIGKKVKALGMGCLTLGSYSESWGYSSIAIGTNATSKAWAISIGGFTSAAGFYSTAIGYKTSATGFYSNALGRESIASGDNSLSFGRETFASGDNSYAFGYQTKAAGNYSYSFGYRSESNNFQAVSMGNYAIASGYSSYSIGSNTKATGSYSMALGYNTTASGTYSLSSGYNSIASGGHCVALGNSTQSSGNATTALGEFTRAAGQASTSMGSNTYAYGFNSVAMGQNTSAQSFCSVVLGRFNTVSGTTYSWIDTDPVFTIGNGTSVTSTSDAFTVLKNGNTGIGTISPVTKLDISGGNNWDLINGDGDLRIGNSLYRLKIGIALAGGGAGGVGIMQYGQVGGYNVLSLGAQGSNQLFINGNTQRVGIGTDNPGYKLTVNGAAWCSSGAWTGSDIRWKKNIKNLSNTLPGILNLQAVNYDLRTDEFPEMGFETGSQIGLIAQDVEKYFPLLVNTNNNGYKAVSYEKLSVILLEGLKEQQTQIEGQHDQIESYKSENDNLKARILTLQEKVEQINTRQKEIDELKILVNTLIANQVGQGK
jgi:hypothetical protein